MDIPKVTHTVHLKPPRQIFRQFLSLHILFLKSTLILAINVEGLPKETASSSL
jgi:hypothetical protein